MTEQDRQLNTNPDPDPAASTGTFAHPARPRRRWRRIFIATLIGATTLGLGWKVFAHGPFGGWGHRAHGFEQMTPEAMQKRSEAMVQWMLADVDATEHQQTQIADIVRKAIADLLPARKQAMEARRAAAELLGRPTIDRAAIEALRLQQIQLADETSRRITQALADAADVLTPEQRARLIERMGRRGRGWHG